MREELAIGPGTTIRVLSNSDRALEVEATYRGKGAPPPPHSHPEQDERFEVVLGALRARLEGQDLQVGLGEVLEIPRGTVHQLWNSGEETAVVEWRTMPAGRTLEWFRELDRMQRGEMADPRARLSEYADVIRLVDAATAARETGRAS